MTIEFPTNTNIIQLHGKIDSCRLCEGVKDFRKSTGLDRGDHGKIVIIGQGPGRSELETQRAFSGQSGRRLDEWLKKAGADPAHPRRGIYMTSILKCYGGPGDLVKMVRNCRRFLVAQLAELKPELIITLGEPSYNELRFANKPYSVALCRLEHSSEFVIITPWGSKAALLPWPHPSGLNRWHNSDENRKRLQASFELVRPYLPKP